MPHRRDIVENLVPVHAVIGWPHHQRTRTHQRLYDDAGTEACEAYGDATGWYGGNQADDNSGVLKYVRIEFAGTLVSPDNELNGIAFRAVIPLLTTYKSI